MKKFAILALSIAIIGSAWGQCTITAPTMLNFSTSGGVTTFDLQFKHVRNDGNKWVTLHLWSQISYPSYDYDRVPTTTRLGGAYRRPFGTVVINNTNVSNAGTYSSSQAYVGTYQNDGTFVMLNTAASTLVYNKASDIYTLRNLKMTLPAGTTAIRFDSWSSQSSDNNNVHCFSTCGTILIPSATPATGLSTFKGVYSKGEVTFTWTTHMESNNSHFLVEEYKDGNWYDVGIVSSKYEDGNCSHDTDYQYTINANRQTAAAGFAGAWPVLLVFAFMFRQIVPARLTILAAVAITMGVVACKGSKDTLLDSLQTGHTYKLRQVDRDGKYADSPQLIMKF